MDDGVEALLKVCPDSRTAFIAEDLLKKLFSHRFFSPAILSRLCTNAFSGRPPCLSAQRRVSFEWPDKKGVRTAPDRQIHHLPGEKLLHPDSPLKISPYLYCEIVIWWDLKELIHLFIQAELKATWSNFGNLDTFVFFSWRPRCVLCSAKPQ